MHPQTLNGKPSGQMSVTRGENGTLISHEQDSDGSKADFRFLLSPDGNTTTVEVTSISKDGKETKSKQVWHRVNDAGAS